MILAWLGDDGDPDPLSTYRRDRAVITATMRRRLTRLWTALERLNLELAVTDQPVIDRARQFLRRPAFARATHSTPLTPSKPAATSSSARTPSSTVSTVSDAWRPVPDPQRSQRRRAGGFTGTVLASDGRGPLASVDDGVMVP